MWAIDKDLISDEGETRVGHSGETINIGMGHISPEYIDLPSGPIVRFRLLDDDGEVYYEGWLNNDSEGLNQQAALEFGRADAGCTTIQVQTKEWKQEIG
jgi:hypothetical protein